MPRRPLRRHSIKETQLANVSYVALIDTVSFGLLAWVVRKVDNVPGDWSTHGFTVTIAGAFVTTLAVSIALLLLTGLIRLIAFAVRALFVKR